MMVSDLVFILLVSGYVVTDTLLIGRMEMPVTFQLTLF